MSDEDKKEEPSGEIEKPLTPEEIQEIQRRNREAIKREFEELKKSRDRSDRIQERWEKL